MHSIQNLPHGNDVLHTAFAITVKAASPTVHLPVDAEREFSVLLDWVVALAVW